MTSFPSRFASPSSSLRTKALLRRARKRLWLALAVAAATHVLLTRLQVLEAETQAAKPLTTQFIKRQPRLTKPLEMKKRPQPKRREVQRMMVSVKARLERGETQARLQPAHVLGGLVRPRSDIGRIGALRSMEMEPASAAQAVEGVKDVEQRIDLSLELLDTEALDTGQFQAMVIEDPDDKRNVRGFCHLAIGTLPRNAIEGLGYSFEYYVLPGFYMLAVAMNQYTQIRTDVLGRLTLNDVALFKVPWLFLWAYCGFSLNDSELQNVGKYLVSGGFIFSEGSTNHGGRMAMINTLQCALDTQGLETQVEKLPNSHPIYHCYFDFDGPPIGGDAAGRANKEPYAYVIDYLEGVEVGGRLAAILTRKNYVHAWTFWGPGRGWSDWDPKRPLQFAVNTIIFALTQEGSITHRLMQSVR